MVLLLVVGFIICNIHSFIWKFWPQTEFIQYDLWLSSKYHLKINVIWYVYEIANILNKIIWCYVLTAIGNKISIKLFWVGITLLGFQFTQFFFYIWNRNTSHLNNIIVYCFMWIAFLEIFIPEKRLGKIVNME